MDSDLEQTLTGTFKIKCWKERCNGHSRLEL